MKNDSSILFKFINKCEDIAMYILSTWCLLPVLMSFINFYNGITKKFPSIEKLIAGGLEKGYIVYSITLNTYRTLFYILGFVTVFFTFLFLSISLKAKKIFTSENFKKTPWFFFLMVMPILALISSLLSDDIYHAFTGGSYMNNGYISFIIFGSVFICASMIKNNNYKKRIILLFDLMICYLCLIMLIQQLNIDFLNYCFPADYATVFNNSNHFAYLLCMSAMSFVGLYLFDNKKFNIVYLFGFAFILYSILLNNTLGSYLAVSVCLPFAYIVYYLNKKNINLKSFLPIIVFFFISTLSYFDILPFCKESLSNNLLELFGDIFKIANKEPGYERGGTGRIVLWIETIGRIKERPLFGFGPDGLIGTHSLLYEQDPHNEFLSCGAYIGVPALIMYLASLFSLCIYRFKNINKLDNMILVTACCVFAYLVSSFFGNVVFNTAPYYWMFLGLCAGVNENEEPLLLPNTNFVFDNSETKINKKHITVLFISSILVIISYFVFVNVYQKATEKVSEKADLEAMKLAKTIGNAYCHNNDSAIGEYWFDDRTCSLISINENKPSSYGYGTSYDAGYKDEFNKENNTNFEYDGSIDYRDKVVKVIISLDDENNYIIDAVWE